MLNGLRGFLAQSKACLAWLWANRRAARRSRPAPLSKRHLPRTLLARDPDAPSLLPDGVVKHVNGREGDSVVFGAALDGAGWEERLLEDGYVVQRAVASPELMDVEVDDCQRTVHCVGRKLRVRRRLLDRRDVRRLLHAPGRTDHLGAGDVRGDAARGVLTVTSALRRSSGTRRPRSTSE